MLALTLFCVTTRGVSRLCTLPCASRAESSASSRNEPLMAPSVMPTAPVGFDTPRFTAVLAGLLPEGVSW